MCNWYSVVDSSRYILVVAVVILDIARNSCCFSALANSYNDSTTTTTTTSTTTINQRTCLPLPSDVLWRRLNHQIPYSDGHRQRSGLDNDNNNNNNNDDDDHQSLDVNSTVKTAGSEVVRRKNGSGSKMKSRDDDESRDESRRLSSSSSSLEKTFRAAATKNQTTSFDDVHRTRRIRKRRLHVRLLRQDEEKDRGASAPDVYRPVTSDAAESAPRRRKRKLPKDGQSPATSAVEQPPHLRHNGKNVPPASAWHCRLEKHWKKMKDGVFPSYIQTGRCTTRTCMMGMYECRPRKYAIGVLKKLKDRCNPLPLSSSGNTTYEDVWIAGHYKVTVACECAKKKRSGSYGPT